MTHQDSRGTLIKHLGRIAPEIDVETIDETADLRDECDIDSMDFFKIDHRTGTRPVASDARVGLRPNAQF